MNVSARGVFCRGESVDRGHVHLFTKGHSGYHVGGQDLHCLEWRVVPRKEKHQSWEGFDGEGPTSSVRRGDARDRREGVPHEVTAVDGRESPLLSPPIKPLAVAAGELEIAFSDCALPTPPGPTPWCGPGSIPNNWQTSVDFSNHRVLNAFGK